MGKSIFLIHLASTWYLVGLCWLVQRVQYPLMDRVGVEGYPAYERAHVDRIGPIVAPMMLLELATAGLLVLTGSEVFRRPLFLVSLVLLVAIWLSTFLLQVPLHRVLAGGFDLDAHASLVRTNWIRTLAWSGRGAILLWMAQKATSQSSL